MARPVSSRSQDDAMVSYIFQRPQTDGNFQAFSKHQSRWLGDESIAEVIQTSVRNMATYNILFWQVKPGLANDAAQASASQPSTVNSQQRSQFDQVDEKPFISIVKTTLCKFRKSNSKQLLLIW